VEEADTSPDMNSQLESPPNEQEENKIAVWYWLAKVPVRCNGKKYCRIFMENKDMNNI
jgi:hypothetical protein